MPLWARGLAWPCGRCYYNGISIEMILVVKKMVINSNIETKKFNEKNFKLWNPKMEDLLLEKDQWITMDPGSTPTRMST